MYRGKETADGIMTNHRQRQKTKAIGELNRSQLCRSCHPVLGRTCGIRDAEAALVIQGSLRPFMGTSKRNDLLERLAKELSNTQQRFGTQEPPNPRLQPAPREGWIPPWRKNLERRNAWTGR
jgi:hypothetical protein